MMPSHTEKSEEAILKKKKRDQLSSIKLGVGVDHQSPEACTNMGRQALTRMVK